MGFLSTSIINPNNNNKDDDNSSTTITTSNTNPTTTTTTTTNIATTDTTEAVSFESVFNTDEQLLLIRHISQTLLSYIRQCEPQKWSIDAYSDEELYNYLNIYEVTSRMIDHHYQITSILMKMYEDVAYKLSPAKFDLSFFRSQVNNTYIKIML